MLGFDAISQAPISDLGQSPVVIALTQTGSTGNVGTATPLGSFALSQVVGTGATGTVVPAFVIPLTQTAGLSVVGSVTPVSAGSAGLSQVAGVGTVGTVSPSSSSNVGLTQVSATGAVGTTIAYFSIPLTQVVGTGFARAVTPSVNLALTQAAGIGGVGSLSPVSAIGLTQDAAPGVVGSVTISSTIGLTQAAATGDVGTITPDNVIQIALTGVASVGDVGSISPISFLDIWEQTNFVVNAGLIVTPIVEWVTSPTLPYSAVVEVLPASGTSVPQWTGVILQASLGPQTTQDNVLVPDVVGLQAYQGSSTCSEAGLLVNNYVYVTGGTPGLMYITAQDLTPGSSVTFGTQITLTVSIG